MSRLLHLRLLTSIPLALACCICVAAPAVSGQTASPPPANGKADPKRAEQAYVAGARLLDHRQLPAAQSEFERAVALNPSRQDYALALILTREQRIGELLQQAANASLTHHPQQASDLIAQARAIDPTNERVLEHTAAPHVPAPQWAPVPEPGFAPPIQLTPSPEPRDLHLRGDIRQVVTGAATAFGITPIFDDSVTREQLRLDLGRTPYSEAMPILLRMAHLFAVPVDSKTLLVTRDTQENRVKFERQVQETIYVPGSTTEQLNELTNIVKNVFDVKQVVASQTSGTLVLRAPAPTLKAVNYTLADLIDGGAEVLMELKLVTIDKSTTRNLGTSPPTQAGIFSVAAEAQQIVSANQSIVTQAIASGAYVPTGNAATDLVQEALYLILSGLATDAKVSNLIAFAGHGLTLTGIYLGSGGTLNLGLSSSESRALDDISVRVGDRQTATLRIGEKYPITTSTYSSGLSSTASSALAGTTINGVSASSLLAQYTSSVATVPIIQYEDLGITLKTTPTVLKSGLISMHVDLKLEALTGASLDNIPILTSRAFTSDITVQEGITAVMLSDLSNTEAASVNGIPGLAELPGFQQTVSDKLKNVASSELLLLITPHLVRHRSNTFAGPRISFNTSVPAEY